MTVKDIRICFVGDSFVNGTGDRAYLGWTGRICQSAAESGYAITYYNLGVRRETSTELVKRWQLETARRLPAGSENKLVFSFGINDTTLEGSQTRIELVNSISNACQILTLAKEQYPTLMIGAPPIADTEQNHRIQTLCQHFASICQEIQVPYLDVFAPLSASSIWMQEVRSGDGAHPDAAGYEEFTQLIRNWSAWNDWFTN